MIFHDITTIIHSAIDTNNTYKIIFFVENLSHFRFVEKLFNYFYEKNANIHLLCLDIPFGNRTYKSDNLTIQVLDSDLEKIKALKSLTSILNSVSYNFRNKFISNLVVKVSNIIVG